MSTTGENKEGAGGEEQTILALAQKLEEQAMELLSLTHQKILGAALEQRPEVELPTNILDRIILTANSASAALSELRGFLATSVFNKIA